MVDALVDVRFDPAVPLADLAHLRYLLGHVVTDPEACEITLLVQLVHLAKGVLERRFSVRAMQVKHV
jgi:hypothetical protein